MSAITEQDRDLLVDVFIHMLREHPIVVTVIFDHPDLRLPPKVLAALKSAPSKTLTLHYGFNLPIPIDCLRVEKQGIFAVLSFNQTPSDTFVPWEAVVGFCPEGSNRSPDPELKKPASKPKLSLVK